MNAAGNAPGSAAGSAPGSQSGRCDEATVRLGCGAEIVCPAAARGSNHKVMHATRPRSTLAGTATVSFTLGTIRIPGPQVRLCRAQGDRRKMARKPESRRRTSGQGHGYWPGTGQKSDWEISIQPVRIQALQMPASMPGPSDLMQEGAGALAGRGPRRVRRLGPVDAGENLPAGVAHQQPGAQQEQKEDDGGNHDDPGHAEARRGLLHMSRNVGTHHTRWDAAIGLHAINDRRKTFPGLAGAQTGQPGRGEPVSGPGSASTARVR